MNLYNEIINLPHYDLRYHKRMPKEERSAQFSSFAALSGFSDDIKEERRRTKKEIYLTEDKEQNLNRKLQIVENQLSKNLPLTILYFEKDKKKEGGDYIEYRGILKRIDKVSKTMIFLDQKKIKLETLIDIEVKEE